jgi:hypothetical protein
MRLRKIKQYSLLSIAFLASYSSQSFSQNLYQVSQLTTTKTSRITPKQPARKSNYKRNSNTLSNKGSFSSQLKRYPDHATAATLSVEQILANTSSPGVTLTASEVDTRRAVIQMYKDFGIDVSLDYTSNPSSVLRNLAPTTWSPQTPQPLSGNFVQPYSIDAPFYHKIPGNSPRTPLPAGYIRTFQYNTVIGGDGIGMGIAISSASDPTRRIRSQWYSNTSTRVDYFMPVRPDAISFLPSNAGGDQHLIFIEGTSKTVLMGYKVSQDPNGVDFNSLYAGGIVPLGTLGDRGGSVAAGFSNIGPLIRPGEATNLNAPIPHAVGGPIRRPWKARVFPASAWDHFIDGAAACGDSGGANTGLVPYGGVIQLDPNLQFTRVSGTNNYTTVIGGQTFTVNLAAYRVLEAMQKYGYYVMDYGCTDLDVYTNTNESEYANYGGSYTVQTQIQNIISRATLYVVPPLVKK